jgi:hypothetical protein
LRFKSVKKPAESSAAKAIQACSSPPRGGAKIAAFPGFIKIINRWKKRFASIQNSKLDIQNFRNIRRKMRTVHDHARHAELKN